MTPPLLMDDRSRDGPPWIRHALGVAAAAAAAALAFLLLAAPHRAPLLPVMVDRAREATGIDNPVNAVLLAFRGWDTLLEVAVLVAAVVAVWSLDRGAPPLAREPEDGPADPVLHQLARLIVPPAATASVYLVWAGTTRPGGAFQAGALLAGAGVLLMAAGFAPAVTAASPVVRGVVASGVLAFVGAGVAGLLRTGAFLAYPEAWAHPLLLGVEAVLAATVTLALIELFVDVPAVPAADPSLERVHPTGDPLGRMLAEALDGLSGGGENPPPPDSVPEGAGRSAEKRTVPGMPEP